MASFSRLSLSLSSRFLLVDLGITLAHRRPDRGSKGKNKCIKCYPSLYNISSREPTVTYKSSARLFFMVCWWKRREVHYTLFVKEDTSNNGSPGFLTRCSTLIKCQLVLLGFQDFFNLNSIFPVKMPVQHIYWCTVQSAIYRMQAGNLLVNP